MRDELPSLGVGLSYRRQLHREIMDRRAEIDFLEIITEDFLDDPEAGVRFAELGAVFPLVIHGTTLSLGTASGLDDDYVNRLVNFVADHRPLWCSEHLSYTRAGTIDTSALQPLWFTQEMIDQVVSNLASLCERLTTRLLLENIAYLVTLPGAEMNEATFISRVLESADVGLLLDVSNLYDNATNFEYDPYDFLDTIPLERVVQIHLGGSRWEGDLLIDTHADPVADGVWPLLEYAVHRSPVRAISFERDTNFPPIGALLEDLALAREIWDLYRRGM